MPPIILGRPPQGQATVPRRHDEEYINRSLLDSLDAQADAEPLSSSDSEAPPSHRDVTSPASSSVTSPSIPFHLGSLSRTQSPPGLIHHTNRGQQPTIDAYVQHHPGIKAPGQPLYNNMHPASAADISSPLSDNGTPRQYDKIQGLASPTFRSQVPYNTFNGRARQGSAAFSRAAPFESFYAGGAGGGAGDSGFLPMGIPPQQVHGPTPQRQSFDALARGSAGVPYDLPTSPPLVGPPGGAFAGVDPFTSAGMAKPGLPVGPRQHASAFHAVSGQAPMSQTPFGPHLPAGGAPPVSAPPMTTVTSTGSTTSQEEISTIFVVGFPDDMSEREFQNMFTFSPGFEAATLKIPNKELTSYGNASNAPRVNGFQQSYGGSHDAYNVVTLNQGGVLVDNGRDGPTTSWPATIPHGDDSHYNNNGPNLPPRKQIIGFAKFRTRQEALDAREVLQGRRVDAEKGAVLKAEMAKKNLHTKRGVGQNTLPNMSGVAGEMIPGIPGLGGIASAHGPTAAGGEPLAQREKELGAVGAMGFGSLRRDHRLSESEDERPMHMMATRGARERAEDAAERERIAATRRREKELRSHNSSAFDAFHSVPQQLAARGAQTNSLLAQGAFDDAPPGLAGFGMPPSRDTFVSAPWAAGGMRRAPSAHNGLAAPHITESGHGSPTHEHEFGSGPPSTTSQDGFDSDTSCNADAGFSDGAREPALRSRESAAALAFRARAFSPVAEQQYAVAAAHPSQPASSASSTSGSSHVPRREELAGAMAALEIRTQHGETSPQMTSPVSNSSSGASATKPNVADQNPPINTLYVGNLPSSPHLQYTNQLEESLKALFSRCQGFRKLCFRQKANGPMCFVEFDDVSFATKALNDLYGNTLDGMIKNGGIRLSYSKNPLGVRTPTGAPGVPAGHAQAQSCDVPYADRGADLDAVPSGRREPAAVTSPTSAYHYSLSPPPPRFFSSSPNAAFAPAPAPISSTAFPRANPQGYSLPSASHSASSASAFSPFGLPSTARMSDQPAPSDEHLIRTLPPLTT